MSDPVAIAVIPARYESKRFAGKPLALVAGVPMVVRVLRNVMAASSVSQVLVATDDVRIADVVAAAGGAVAMTSADAPSGSDRVWQAVRDLACDVVVNVQGDEPLLPASVVDALVARLAEGQADITTPVVAIPRAQAVGPDVVTVAVDEAGVAHYFSRSVIPSGADPVWQHVGVYAYRRRALERFVGTPPSALEQVERLEQLRALSLGLRIEAVSVDCRLQAVDRPGDVARVESLLPGERPRGAMAAVRLVVLDVDGVLTDGRIVYGLDAEQLLHFDSKDGYGVVAMRRAGIEVAILSGRDSLALRRRAEELGIREVRGGVADKEAGLIALCADLGVPLGETCYVGDDDPDAAAMAVAGWSAAPSDASPWALAAAKVILTRPGGRGAVRELADLLLPPDGNG